MRPTFPTRYPLYTWLAIALSVSVAWGSFATWRHYTSPLQMFYLTSAGHCSYLATGNVAERVLASAINGDRGRALKGIVRSGLSRKPSGDTGHSSHIQPKTFVREWTQSEQTGRYLVWAHGERLATPDTPRDRLRCVAINAAAAELHRELAREVYGGGLIVAMRWPLRIAGWFVALVIVAGRVMDIRRRRDAREGIPMRGSKMLTWRGYNRRSWFRRRLRGEGIEIELA